MRNKINWLEKRNNEIEILLECINQKYSITREIIISKSRKKELVMARRLFMNVLFETFEQEDKEMTQYDISKVISRDRASFIHHRKGHLGEYNRYKEYKKEYNDFKNEFIEKIKVINTLV
jgi:chromosomal replication initiation ATPase DnaA